jgi:serine/threonine-protein kinase RsbW
MDERRVDTQLPRGSRAASVPPGLALRMPATRENLARVRGRVESFLRLELERRAARVPFEEVMLAVQEALANVVRHAYPADDAPGPLRVEAEVTDLLLRITVVDEGRGYDPGAVPLPDPSAPRDGGYGLFLIGRTMSRVTYRRGDDCNRLVMEKLLERRDPGPGPQR